MNEDTARQDEAEIVEEAHRLEAELAAFDDALIRTHLANERTFLAWLRSAVVLLGVGLGAVALGGTGDLDEAVALVLGGVSTVTALVMVVWGYQSFATTAADIDRRRYRAPSVFIATATALVAVAGAIVIVLLVAEALD